MEAIEGGRIRVDCAILATSGSHVDDALALVRAGVRVLVEKPLALSHGELDRLQAGLEHLGAEPDEWIRVGYMKEHDPAVARARAVAQLSHTDPDAVGRLELIRFVLSSQGNHEAFACELARDED